MYYRHSRCPWILLYQHNKNAVYTLQTYIIRKVGNDNLYKKLDGKKRVYLGRKELFGVVLNY